MRVVRQLRSPVILTALFSAVISSKPAGAEPPARIGRVSYLSGSVSFRADGSDDWAAATLNYPVTTGDELWSPAAARAEVHIGSSAVRLGAQTLVDFLDVSDQSTQLRLTQGSLYVRVRELKSGDTYEVETPNGTVSLLGAGHYRIDVPSEDRPTTITVRDGRAEVTTGGGAAVSVRPGETMTVTGPQSPTSLVTTVAVDDWETWCEARDRRDDESLSLRYVSPELVGFEDLDGYGRWQVDASFGPVWVPAVPAGWSPYRFGSWAWVAPWGWTWIDDAAWGFAPFHYGRWAFLGGAWGWVPGEKVDFPVYAPALVAFVGGSGFDLSLAFGAGGGLAWFPLAPGEVYVPAYRVSRTYIRDVNITSVNLKDVDLTKIDVTKVRYVNRSVPGAVTAVSRETFLKGAPVAKAAVRVPQSAVARATVVGTSAPLAPRKEHVVPRTTARRVAEPPAAAVNRPVITGHTRSPARAASPGERQAPAPASRTTAGAAATSDGPADAARRREWQTERNQALARQAAERAELERRQQAELSTPPTGASLDDLRQRQAQEREALVQRHHAETDTLDRRYRRERG
jgi:hypothetical protein